MFIAVASHWALDFISHRPDMPLAPGVQRYYGLGLFNSRPGMLLVEGLIWFGGIALYELTTRSRGRGELDALRGRGDPDLALDQQSQWWTTASCPYYHRHHRSYLPRDPRRMELRRRETTVRADELINTHRFRGCSGYSPVRHKCEPHHQPQLPRTYCSPRL